VICNAVFHNSVRNVSAPTIPWGFIACRLDGGDATARTCLMHHVL